MFIPDFRFSLLFFISLLGAYLNWLFCSFAAFFQTGLVVIITVVEPPHPTTPHPADTARLACHPSPGRAASHSLVCEQMDVVTVDAVTAFIIVYTLFFVSCFTDKSFRSNHSSLCVASDKLVASLPFPLSTIRINSLVVSLSGSLG
jgi:hypothetical protein